MKKVNLFYWIVTGLLSVFILLGAAMDVLKTPQAMQFIKELGYPEYFTQFIGVLKILGIIAVLNPKFPKLKEWAYAGLTFDTFGAIYSHLSNGDGANKWLPAFIGLVLVLGSYALYTKRSNIK